MKQASVTITLKVKVEYDEKKLSNSVMERLSQIASYACDLAVNPNISSVLEGVHILDYETSIDDVENLAYKDMEIYEVPDPPKSRYFNLFMYDKVCDKAPVFQVDNDENAVQYAINIAQRYLYDIGTSADSSYSIRESLPKGVYGGKIELPKLKFD